MKASNFFLFGLLIFLMGTMQAQQYKGVGLRFASNINYFPHAIQYNLVQKGFTTGVLGMYWSNYAPRSGFEIGANVVYKNSDNKGFPNLPAVMADFSPNQSVGITAIEMDLKVGPRFNAWNPKIGYVLGYRFTSEGFLRDGASGEIQSLYIMLPFGLSGIWPTNFGTVGVGAFYNVGLLNVLKDPNPRKGSLYDGGRHRYINLELIVTYGQ